MAKDPLSWVDNQVLDWLGNNLDKVSGLQLTNEWLAANWTTQELFDFADVDRYTREYVYNHINSVIEDWDEYFSDMVYEAYLIGQQEINKTEDKNRSIFDTIKNTVSDGIDTVVNIADTITDLLPKPLNDALDTIDDWTIGSELFTNFVTNPFEWPAEALGKLGEGLVKGFTAIFDQFLNLADDVVEDTMVKMAEISANASKRIAELSQKKGE